MQADVVLLKAGQNEINRRLFGNGQPGAMKELSDDIEDLKLWRARNEGHASANRRWSAGISMIVGAAVSAFMEWLTHRGMR